MQHGSGLICVIINARIMGSEDPVIIETLSSYTLIIHTHPSFPRFMTMDPSQLQIFKTIKEFRVSNMIRYCFNY